MRVVVATVLSDGDWSLDSADVVARPASAVRSVGRRCKLVMIRPGRRHGVEVVRIRLALGDAPGAPQAIDIAPRIRDLAKVENVTPLSGSKKAARSARIGLGTHAGRLQG